MGLLPELVPYVVERRAREALELASSLGLPAELQFAALREVLSVAAGYASPSYSGVELATMTFRKLKSVLGSQDPYKEAGVKKRELQAAKKVLKELKESLPKEPEERAARLAALLASVSGANSVVEGSLEAVERSLREGLFATLKGAKLSELLESARRARVALVPSSYCSFELDLELAKIFSEELDASVSVFLKLQAYENDVTYGEAAQEFDVPSGLPLVPLATDAAGPSKHLLQRAEAELLLQHDVVVATGLMNYLGLLELARSGRGRAKVFALLRVDSCGLAKRLGLPCGEPAVAKA